MTNSVTTASLSRRWSNFIKSRWNRIYIEEQQVKEKKHEGDIEYFFSYSDL